MCIAFGDAYALIQYTQTRHVYWTNTVHYNIVMCVRSDGFSFGGTFYSIHKTSKSCTRDTHIDTQSSTNGLHAYNIDFTFAVVCDCP